MNEKLLPFCECGKCGLRVRKVGHRFIHGHNRRGKHEHKPLLTDAHIAALIASHLKEKEPLPNGKTNKITPNKNSASYLGGIAEQALIRIFKDVQVMPNYNPGFDFHCAKKYRIDGKSSATGHKGHWYFNISKNVIADYFLCLAFESRDDLTNPVHLWLIPGNVVNHLIGIAIRKTTLHKWSQYEQPIDKVRECCNEMKEEIKS